MIKVTRSNKKINKKLCDALRQLKSCLLLHNYTKIFISKDLKNARCADKIIHRKWRDWN